MKKSNIKRRLDDLANEDIYSMVLFTLFKLSNNPEYSTLSELVYLVDKNSLFNLISVFGGMTIRIPTVDELKVVVGGLLLYQMVNVDGKDFKESLDSIEMEETQTRAIKSSYSKICEVMENYEFNKR